MSMTIPTGRTTTGNGVISAAWNGNGSRDTGKERLGKETGIGGTWKKKSGIGGADGKHGVEEYLVTHVTYLDTYEDM